MCFSHQTKRVYRMTHQTNTWERLMKASYWRQNTVNDPSSPPYTSNILQLTNATKESTSNETTARSKFK